MNSLVCVFFFFVKAAAVYYMRRHRGEKANEFSPTRLVCSVFAINLFAIDHKNKLAKART